MRQPGEAGPWGPSCRRRQQTVKGSLELDAGEGLLNAAFPAARQSASEGSAFVISVATPMGSASGQSWASESVALFADNARRLVSEAVKGRVGAGENSGNGSRRAAWGEGGGRIALTGPAGGKTAVGLSVNLQGACIPTGWRSADGANRRSDWQAVTVYDRGRAVAMLRATACRATRSTAGRFCRSRSPGNASAWFARARRGTLGGGNSDAILGEGALAPAAVSWTRFSYDDLGRKRWRAVSDSCLHSRPRPRDGRVGSDPAALKLGIFPFTDATAPATGPRAPMSAGR